MDEGHALTFLAETPQEFPHLKRARVDVATRTRLVDWMDFWLSDRESVD